MDTAVYLENRHESEMSSSETEFQGLKPVGWAIRVLAKRGGAGVLENDKMMLRLASQQGGIVVVEAQNDPTGYAQSNTNGGVQTKKFYFL